MNFNTFYIFVACCLCLFYAGNLIQAEIVCPTEQPDDSLVIQFPSPTNCSEFYKCNRGVPVAIPCPKGLHYNARLQVCDYPKHANCKLATTA